uniref:Polyprenal reductase n=1 Tax=Syphacia muris TaxID=451379 RepID=A0A0N5AJI8_9BILA
FWNFSCFLCILQLNFRWFWIFYFVGVVCTSLILLILVGYNVHLGSKLLQLVGLTIYLVHVSRRLYETLYISVFSSNSTINIFHFLLGITYYILTPVSQLLTLKVSEIRSFDLILCCFLLILQYQQNICFRILANLRTGNVNNDDDAYIIPKNHLFSYLSCPHFTIEILIYIVFTIYYRFFSAVAFCCLFVVVNQTIAAILNHRWYMQKFGSDYPSSKRILIPFIF